MKEKLMNATIATMLVITLTMANFIILGVNVVTYASELLHQTSETNYKNVEFTAYFKTDVGDKIDMAQTPINTENLKLYMQVTVKEEGYFLGEIEVANSNFTVDSNKLSNEINKIEGNTITLNQINAGQTVEVEVGITPIKDNSIDQGLLSTVTDVNLKGTYVSNKEKQTQIDSTKNVQLVLQSPYTDNERMQLSSEIITNKLINVEETNQVNNTTTQTAKITKRMIQAKVRSGLQGNGYPIKETNIKLTIPEQTEKIEVSSQGTKATNGTTKLAWERGEGEKAINVKIENTPSEENKIAWAKSGEDVVVVTYILPKEVEVTNTNIEVTSEIKLYDHKETTISKNTVVKVEEEKDGTIEFEETSSETSIYKGKIYSKENRQIKTNTNIFVNYQAQTEKIKISEKPATYVGEGEILANVQYKSTTISKSQIEKILGEEGYLAIFDENGSQLSKITKDTQANEIGNLVIEYPENVRTIKVETSKPVAKGKITLKHIKTIKADEYNRDTIRNVNKLRQGISAVYNKEQKTAVADIELKETDTKASLAINNNKISTQRETDIEMRVTLNANKEQYDLYKNPLVKVQLPSEVTKATISNISLLYDEEMQIVDAKYDNNTKTIIIQLKGEQTKYHTDLNEGAQIYIAAKVLADELTPSKKAEISLTYNNENSVSGEKTEKLPIKIESKYGLMLYSRALNYNNANESIKTIDSETAVGKLDISSSAKTATMNLAVLNNYETIISNVAVVGRVPAGTFDTKLAQEIKTTIEGAKVYYSTNSSAGANDEGWVENITNLEEIKSYKIVLDKMEPAQVLKFAYTFTIPENLPYNQVVDASYTATYKYVEQEMEATSALQFKTQEKKLVQYLENNSRARVASQVLRSATTENGLKVETLVTTSGGDNKVTLKDGDCVYEGQTLHYTVKVTNDTGADLNNVKATVTQTNAKFYGETKEEVDIIDQDDNFTVKKGTYTIHEELDNKELVFDIEKIENGKEKIFEYEVVIGEVDSEATSEATIKIQAGDQESIEKGASYKIKQGKVKVLQKVTSEEELYKIGGATLPIYTEITNISGETIKDIIVEIPIPKDKKLSFDPQSFEEMMDPEDDSLELLEHNEDKVKYKYKGTIGIGETQYIKTIFNVGLFQQEKEQIEIYSIITLNEEIYTSNVYSVVYEKSQMFSEDTDLGIEQISNPKSGTYLENGTEVTYLLNIKNNGNARSFGNVKFDKPNGMQIQKIYIVRENKETDITDKYNINSDPQVDTDENGEQYIYYESEDTKYTIPLGDDLSVDTWIKPDETVQVKVVAKLDIELLESMEDKEAITNKFIVQDDVAMKSIESNTITHYAIVPKETQEQNENNSNSLNNNTQNNSSSSIQNNNLSNQQISYYNISGTVWMDKNKDGKMNDESASIDNVQIKVANKNGEFAKNKKGEEITAKVSEGGKYTIELPKGEYIIVFIYDTGKYALTTYSNSENGSNVIERTMEINGTETKVAVTNSINLQANKTNVNMGLIQKENFSLSLKKSVNKVTVQNKEGTKVKQFNNTQLAKVEVRAKHFSGTNLIVEYKIDVTNNGDVDGYINDVVDFIPEGYKFSSDMNSTWYQSTDKNLHNNSLANEKIKAGETKTLTLVLTKTLTENDTGLIVNTAEIANSSSVTGASDVNSTANNKATGEDDISSANLLVSVSTGAKTACIIGIIISFVLVGLCVYMIKRGEGE